MTNENEDPNIPSNFAKLINKTDRLHSSTDDRPFLVSVEGNVGSGKSTFLSFFSKFNDVDVKPEPVTKWCNLDGHNLLQELYADPCRRSFQFQSYVQLTRLQILLEPCKSSVKMIERSLQNNRYCFLTLAERRKTLTPVELSVLHSWHQFLATIANLDIDLIVYLRTSPDVAYQRMRQRNRREESAADQAYLDDLHSAYEDWLMSGHDSLRKTAILVVDANQDIDALEKIYLKYQDAILGTTRLPYGLTFASST